MPSGGLAAREKGVRFEREVAAALRGFFPNARRNFGQARSGSEAPDIEIPGFWVEVKHRRSVSVWATLAQAVAEVEANGSSKVPMAVCKAHGGSTLVAMYFGDFLRVFAPALAAMGEEGKAK